MSQLCDVKEGTKGAAVTRLRGRERHVTIYPHMRGLDNGTTLVPLSTESTTAEVEVVLKGHDWWLTTDWTELEPGVFVAQIVKGQQEGVNIQ